MHVIKMHSLGNDYALVDCIPNVDYEELAKKVCDRHLGIGAMGLIVAEKTPLRMTCYDKFGKKHNPVGSEICCYSRYVSGLNLARHDHLDITTSGEMINVLVVDKENFKCQIDYKKAIFNNQVVYAKDVLDVFGREFIIDGIKVKTYTFYLGKITTVVFVDSFDNDVINLREKISKLDVFTRGTNVVFAKVKTKTEIEVKCFDCILKDISSSLELSAAAVVCANKLGLTKPNVRVMNSLGLIDIEINKKGNVFVTAPSKKIFECEFKED